MAVVLLTAIAGPLLLWAAPAQAAPAPLAPRPELRLQWTTPESCPDESAAHASISHRLAESPVTERRLDAEVTVVAREGRYDAELVVREGDERSTRSWSATDCAEAAETAMLLLAITIDPLAAPATPPLDETASAEAEAEGSAAPPKPLAGQDGEPDEGPMEADTTDAAETDDTTGGGQEPTAPPSPTDDEAVRGPAPSRPSLRARLRAGVGFGPLPTAAAVIEGGLGWGGARWQVDAGLEFWAPSTGGTAPARGADLRAWLVAAGVRGCFTPAAGAWTFPLCGGAQVGIMTARGENVAIAETARSAWVALRAGPSAIWWVRPWLGVGGGADADVALYQPRFSTSPSGRVHQARAGGVRGLLGVSFRAPARESLRRK